MSADVYYKRLCCISTKVSQTRSVTIEVRTSMETLTTNSIKEQAESAEVDNQLVQQPAVVTL